MWIIAGGLLGLVVLASLVGFHSGPHTHVAAGVVGVVVAVWLIVMALGGRSAPVVWALFGADVVISIGVGAVAWKGLSAGGAAEHHLGSLEGAQGVAVSDLTPEGIVRVRGEQWSVLAVNGTAAAGTTVHVVRSAGVRLEVWAEGARSDPVGDLFTLPGSTARSDVPLLAPEEPEPVRTPDRPGTSGEQSGRPGAGTANL